VKIYVVTDGCYSDYSVICLRSKEEDARTLAEFLGEDGRYFDMEVDGSGDLELAKLREGMHRFCANYFEDGKILIRKMSGGIANRRCNSDEVSFTSCCSIPCDGTTYTRALTTDIWALDEKHAEKIARERFSKANGLLS